MIPIVSSKLNIIHTVRSQKNRLCGAPTANGTHPRLFTTPKRSRINPIFRLFISSKNPCPTWHPPSPLRLTRTSTLPPTMPGGYRVLSFQHFISLAIVLILAATSTVSFADIAFVVLSIPYLVLLSTVTFPPSPSSPPPVFSAQEKRLLGFYVSIGGVVGLLLPLLQILHSLVVRDTHNIAVTAPHLFLLSAQIFLEGISFGYGFSLPARAAVPIIYNTKRLFTIADWVRHVVGGVSVGCAIALANTVFWGFNLLGFLLPVYLPRVLKLYYCDEGSKKSS